MESNEQDKRFDMIMLLQLSTFFVVISNIFRNMGYELASVASAIGCVICLGGAVYRTKK